MKENIKSFLDIIAGLREEYYKKDRELCAIKELKQELKELEDEIYND